MITVKITYSNGNTNITGINTDLEGAKRYYLGNVFNLGVEDDLLVRVVKVEALTEAQTVKLEGRY